MELDEFQARIRNRLEQQKEEEQAKCSEIEESMRQLDEKRSNFKKQTRGFLFTGIRDRLKGLNDNFANLKIHSGDNHCTVEFAHTIEYPCTTTLCFSISPGPDSMGFVVQYDLTILPIFVDYKKHDEDTFSFTDAGRSSALAWVEERIFEFLDTYMNVRNHPAYQKSNMVTDPICGMVFPVASAADSIKIDERKIVYFCSLTCKTAYESNHDD